MNLSLVYLSFVSVMQALRKRNVTSLTSENTLATFAGRNMINTLLIGPTEKFTPVKNLPSSAMFATKSSVVPTVLKTIST